MAAFAQVSAAFAEHSGTFDVLINIGMTVAEIFGGVLVGAFIVFANVVVSVITTAIGIVTSVINGIVGVLTGIITFITGVFAGDWSMAWNGIVEVFSSIFGMLANIASNVLGGIKNMVTGIIQDVKNFASGESGGGGGQEIAANACGGIYRKGAFLTTFAEDSAEAAIPLDGSPRAIGLWRKAGELLGIEQEDGGEPPSSVTRVSVSGASESGAAPTTNTMQQMNAPPISITLNFSGNVQPEKVKQAVESAAQTVQKTFAEQMEAYNRERGRLAFG